MSETTERVAVTCPSCSPSVETVHEVLKPDGQATVRCAECGHVHKTGIEPGETTTKDVIVSQDGESFHTTVEAPADERIAVGEEFVVETDEAIFTVRITSLEVGDEQRAQRAPVREIETIWTRAVGNVRVNVTVNPRDGRHDATRSVAMYVPGDYEFTIGETESAGEESFVVTGLHLRDDAQGYEFEKLDYEGDAALAKDVKRVYARDESAARSAWSGW